MEQLNGPGLDVVGRILGVPRKTYLFIFNESDKSYRKRMIQRMRDLKPKTPWLE